MLRAVLYWISQKRWLLFAAALSFALYQLPYPAGLSLNGYRTINIVIIVLILIVSEAVPLPAIALLIAVLQVSFGLGEPNEVARSYMNDAVFFIMGSLMLAVAIVKQGLDARLTLGILALTGTKVTSIMWGFFIISLLLTSFIGEHTVVAMLLPVVLTLVRNTSEDAGEVKNITHLLLFALIYGSIIGSIGTPSGGARNAIMIGYWQDFGLAKIGYLEWMTYTYPLMLAQIPFGGWILIRAFKPEQQRLDRAVRNLREQVGRSGELTGQQILAIILFVGIFLAWIFLSDHIGMGIVALGGVFLYLATGLVEWQEINQRTNWGVVLLFAAVISLGLQLRNTGAALWLAHHLLSIMDPVLQQFALAQYLLVMVVTTVVANVMSSSATVAVLGPLFINFEGNTVFLGFTTAVASAFGYFTTVGSPAGMIVAATGLVKAKDFLRAGWRFALMSAFFLILAILIYWPRIYTEA